MSEEIEKRFDKIFKPSLVERIYRKLGFTNLGSFLYQTILFIFASILFIYLLYNIPQEAVKYEAYKPYIDLVEGCLQNHTKPVIWCSSFKIQFP